MNGRWELANGFHYFYLNDDKHPNYSGLVYEKRRNNKPTPNPWFVWLINDILAPSARQTQLANCQTLEEAKDSVEEAVKRVAP